MPRLTASAPNAMTTGIVLITFLAAAAASVPWVTMTSQLRRTNSAAIFWKTLYLSLTIPVIDCEVLPLDIADLT